MLWFSSHLAEMGWYLRFYTFNNLPDDTDAIGPRTTQQDFKPRIDKWVLWKIKNKKTVNMLGFVITMQLCCCSTKASTNNTWTEWVWLHSNKTLVIIYEFYAVFIYLENIEVGNVFFYFLILKMWKPLLVCGHTESQCVRYALRAEVATTWLKAVLLYSSVQFSHSLMSNSLWPHGLQHARLPYPSPTLGANSNSCHQVSDAVQSSHPLQSPSPATFNLSWHQGLCQLVRSSHQVAKAPEFHLQHQSFQWIFRTDFL